MLCLNTHCLFIPSATAECNCSVTTCLQCKWNVNKWKLKNVNGIIKRTYEQTSNTFLRTQTPTAIHAFIAFCLGNAPQRFLLIVNTRKSEKNVEDIKTNQKFFTGKWLYGSKKSEYVVNKHTRSFDDLASIRSFSVVTASPLQKDKTAYWRKNCFNLTRQVLVI